MEGGPITRPQCICVFVWFELNVEPLKLFTISEFIFSDTVISFTKNVIFECKSFHVVTDLWLFETVDFLLVDRILKSLVPFMKINRCYSLLRFCIFISNFLV